MTTEMFIRYIHFISLFAVASTIVAEHLLLKKSMPRKAFNRLTRIDNIYGLAAIVMVGSGLLLWFVVGKDASYYNQNWIFHLKLTLAILLALLSLWPTLFFRKQRRGDPDESVDVPKSILMTIRVELLLLLTIPLLASIMAKGMGYFG